MFEDDEKVTPEQKDTMAEAIGELLIKNKDSLKTTTIDMVKRELIKKIEWQVTDPINDCIRDFIQKEIKPEIEKHLISSKPAIIKGIAEVIDGIGGAIKDALAQKAAANIASGYKIDKVIDGLFK